MRRKKKSQSKKEKEDWRSRLQCPMAENKWDLLVQWRLVAIHQTPVQGIQLISVFSFLFILDTGNANSCFLQVTT